MFDMEVSCSGDIPPPPVLGAAEGEMDMAVLVAVVTRLDVVTRFDVVVMDSALDVGTGTDEFEKNEILITSVGCCGDGEGSSGGAFVLGSRRLICHGGGSL